MHCQPTVFGHICFFFYSIHYVSKYLSMQLGYFLKPCIKYLGFDIYNCGGGTTRHSEDKVCVNLYF